MNKDLKEKFAFTLGATHVGISHNIGGTLHRFVESFTHVGISHNTRRVGFTLAEVLITLGIIGIVSAMTIPTLINNYKEKVRDNQFKKVYAMLNQAVKLTAIDFNNRPRCHYGTPFANADCNDFNLELRNNMKVIKFCDTKSYDNGCIPDYDGAEVHWKEIYKDREDYDEEYWDNYVMTNIPGWSTEYIKNINSSYVLNDGTIIINYRKGSHPLIMVDINGMAGPNKFGYDVFSFRYYYDGNGFYITGNSVISAKGGLQADKLIQKLFGTKTKF